VSDILDVRYKHSPEAAEIKSRTHCRQLSISSTQSLRQFNSQVLDF
jgi:hypothetical protein